MRRIIALLVLILIYLLLTNVFSEKSNLERLLKDVNLKVTVRNTQVSIEKGKVKKDDSISTQALRIAAFYYWNKEDPLMTSPDFDPAQFEKVVSSLEGYQKDLLAFLGKNKHVYPTDFLKAVGSVSQAQKDFMSNPTDKNAELLLDKQEAAVAAYRNEAKVLLSEVSVAKREEPVFINTITTTDIIQRDVTLLLKNADSLQAEIDKRRACLGRGEGCTRPGLAFAKPMDFIKNENVQPPQFLDKNLVFKLIGKEVDGPYVVNTPCYGWNSDFSYPKQYFYIDYLTRDNLPSVNIQQATNLYFDYIPADTQIDYQKKLLSQGIPYVFSSSTAPYKCADLGYLAEALTVSNFTLNYKPIFPLSKAKYDPQFFKQASDSEKTFFQEKYPSYSDLSKLSSIYGYAYKVMAENNDNSSIKEEFLKRKLDIDRRLSDFPMLLNYITQYIRERLQFEKDEAANSPDLSKNYIVPKFLSSDLYTFRSYYGLMYFPFSPSFWRLGEKPQYLSKTIVTNALGINSYYLDYKSAIKKYSAEQINSWRILRATLYDY